MKMVTCNSFLIFLAVLNHGANGAIQIHGTRNMIKDESSYSFNTTMSSGNKDISVIDHRQLQASNLPPFLDFALQVVSGLHSSQDPMNWKFLTGDYDKNGNVPDVYAIKMQGETSTEVHILDGNSNYKVFSLHAPTPLHKTDGNGFDYGLADFNNDGKLDLYGIKRQGVSSTEVHILDGASNFQVFSLHAPTPLGKTGPEWTFLVGDYNCDGVADIYAINRYGNKNTEVSVLNGKDNFQTFLLQNNPTALHKTGMDFEFSLKDYNADGKPDIYAILRQGGSLSTEVHVLNGASNFCDFLLHSKTALPPTSCAWKFLVADYDADGKPDLFGLDMRKDFPGQKTEVHIVKWNTVKQPLYLPIQDPTLQLVCASIPTTGYFKVIARHSNLAMNVISGLIQNNGAGINQFPSGQAIDGNWRFQSVGNNIYNIIAAGSEKSLNVGVRDNGSKVTQWDVSPGVDDDWCFVAKGAGYYAIYNRGTGKVLSVSNGSTTPGALVTQSDYTNDASQLWKVSATPTVDLCIRRYGQAPTADTCDTRTRIGSLSQLDNKPTDLLNTAVDNETPEMTQTRLNGGVPIQDSSNINSLYDPVYDAYCFNEDYPVPSFSTTQQYNMYLDYKTEFDRILAFTTDVSEKNNQVTNNRIPGMFLRMCFHDNSVSTSGPDFQDYIERSIDPTTRTWIGEVQYLKTSGADASNLICPQERYHPNQNYDQTATRVLNSIQRTLKNKYKNLSYADLLHNGCNAATIYLTGQDPMNGLRKNPMTFGRKDACYKDTKCTKKYALCGPTELLPGLALSVKGVTDWFRLRGMSECLFMGLMWTHTTVDNMASMCPIKKLSCTANTADVSAFYDKRKMYFKSGDYLDYFSFFLGRGTMQTLPDTGDDSAPNCNWYVNGQQVPWPMTGIDCTVGLDNVQKAGEIALANAIRNLAHNPVYNKVDILQCALKILGGKGGVEGGACNLVLPTECKSSQNHKFGGYYSTLTNITNIQQQVVRTTIDPQCAVAGF